jgi:hypothetical protein
MSDKIAGEELIERLQHFLTEAERTQRAIAFLRDDAAAISYQSLGQYRTALLRILGGVENGGQTCDMPSGPCACGAWHDAPTTRPAQMDSVCGKPKPDADREPKTTPFAKPIATPIQVKQR